MRTALLFIFGLLLAMWVALVSLFAPQYFSKIAGSVSQNIFERVLGFEVSVNYHVSTPAIREVNRMLSKKSRVGGIDPAALAAATLAVAVSAIGPPGPYGPVGMMIGGTVLLLIFAYDVDPNRNKFQSVAFSAVCALILLLTVGFPLEIVSAADSAGRFGVILKEPQKDIEFSEVRPYVALLFWCLSTVGIFALDRFRAQRKRRQNE